jgi:ATP-binding cassette subfamily B protein
MGMEYLRTAAHPCILHIINDQLVPHFIVCFGYDDQLGSYLIGDPDGEVVYWPEGKVSERWTSRAALWYDDMPRDTAWRISFYPWYNMRHFRIIPGVLWFAVPLLNAFGTLLGLGATLIIEKSVSQQFLEAGLTLMILIFVLLFSLSAARCMINYIKERLIINFAGKLDRSLFLEFSEPLERSLFNSRQLVRRFGDTIKDVQRIHQAASMLIGGILCDIVMVVIMLCALYFYFPELILPESGIVIVLLWLTDKQLPFMLVNYQSGQNTDLLSPATRIAGEQDHRKNMLKNGIEANDGFSRKSTTLSINANRLNLYFEAISSLNVIVVLAFTMIQLKNGNASYQEFLFGIILSYAIIGSATKICNQLFLVAHGTMMLERRANTT